MMMDMKTPVTSNSYGGKLELTLRPFENLLVYSGLDAEIIKRDGKNPNYQEKHDGSNIGSTHCKNR